jgi:hypothetical protein
MAARKKRPNKAERRRTRAIEEIVGDDAKREIMVQIFSEFSSTIRADSAYRQGIHEGKRELAMWWIQQCHNASKDCGLRMLSALTGGVEEWPRQSSKAQAKDPEQTDTEERPEET